MEQLFPADHPMCFCIEFQKIILGRRQGGDNTVYLRSITHPK
ncbi:Uncharacterized protein dnl_32120 [Desulfonema limicola]|uniref:Uncharacterized protein n=1 Tax=Desulfonema limicola TaxID=45656 RepID=A0A975B8I7_9BACT|nr:Uncharacterized protein dnl_32120 [Desulfonema limicola]